MRKYLIFKYIKKNLEEMKKKWEIKKKVLNEKL